MTGHFKGRGLFQLGIFEAGHNYRKLSRSNREGWLDTMENLETTLAKPTSPALLPLAFMPLVIANYAARGVAKPLHA